MTERVNIPIEKAVLGALMLDPSMVPIIAPLAPPEDFHHPQHALAMRAICELSTKRGSIDPLTLAAHSNGALDAPTLSALMHAVGTAANVETHARIVAENARARRLANAGSSIFAKSRDPLVSADEIEAHARATIEQASKQNDMRLPATGQEMAVELYEDIEAAIARRMSGSVISGLGTGLPALDAITGGWRPANLILIGARPGVGKSALAHKILCAGAETQKPALMFQIEMRRRALFLRMIADRSGIQSKQIRSGEVNEADMGEIVKAANTLSMLPIRVDDDGAVTIDQIRSRTLRMHNETPLSLVVIDYLQKIRVGRTKRMESREREVNEIVGALQALAKETNVPIVALASLNRECEQRPDRRPQASDIRETGGAESDADIVLLLYRASKYKHLRRAERNGIVEAIVAKNRDGDESTAFLRYFDSVTRFADATDEERDAYLQSWESAPRQQSRRMRAHGGYAAGADND